MSHEIVVTATWFRTRQQYVADVERHGGSWYSSDGDNWTYENGAGVSGPIFDAVSIRLEGGPRKDEVVS